MINNSYSHDLLGRSPRSRSAFSFVEVMFAVVILGIGFIMIAAIFPVAIKQTQASSEENNAAAAAREATNAIIAVPVAIPNPNFSASYQLATPPVFATACQAVRRYQSFPPTIKNYVLPSPTGTGAVPPAPIVVPFVGSRWQMVQSGAIVNCDPRYAYVPFYKRGNDPAAELIVVAVSVRNKPIYDTVNDGLNSASFMPVTTSPALYAGNSGTQTQVCPDTIQVSGATVIEGSCFTTASNRTYTVGRPRGLGMFDLCPGDGMALTQGTDGNWGTAGRIYDAPSTGQSCAFKSPATLQPVVAYATLAATPIITNGQITLYTDSTSTNAPTAAGPGAFVIVSDDFPFDPANPSSPTYNLTPNIPATAQGFSPPVIGYSVGALNGRIFRLSSVATDNLARPAAGGVVYNLDPAYGMTLPPDTFPIGSQPPNVSADTVPNPAASTYWGAATAAKFRVKVYIVGVGADANNGGARIGVSQDIGVFNTYFPVN